MRKKLLEQVLKKITPGKLERKKQEALSERLLARIMKTGGSHVDVMLCGSNARDTHLKGDNDLDIFVFFPEKLSRPEFEKAGLKIGKQVFRGHKWEKAFSEHPYIRGEIDGFDVEIVPCYKVGSAESRQSAVDRSPFHNEYLKKRLGGKKKQEARLLRQFLKGIKCYGADTRASSIPGYVVELLILKYGSFTGAVKAIAEWKQGQAIDIENHGGGEEAGKLFPGAALVVIDPVDKNRNVAAALSLNQFSRMVAASRAFLKKPSQAFFFGKKERPWTVKKLRAMLQKKELIAVKLGYPKKALADIVWGQIQRLARKAEKQMLLNGFNVVRSEAWTDEKHDIILLFQVESRQLQKSTVKQGPFVTDEKNSKAFLKAHPRVIAGPRIEQGKWVIEIPRKYTSVEKFLPDFIKNAKQAETGELRKALNKGSSIMEEKNIIAAYKKNKEFSGFITAFLRGEEEFLCY
jgi:tRNA nucleotidyltransferase (CCA-adding enzyme)